MTPFAGYSLLIGTGILYFLVAFITHKRKVKDPHSFVIGERSIGTGLGVGAIIAAWTWAVAVMMSSGCAYAWGFSGLWNMVWPNGSAVLLLIPLARRLRKMLPTGYTLAEFARLRFDTKNHILWWVSIVFVSITAVAVNGKGVTLAFDHIFGTHGMAISIITVIIVVTYGVFGGIWTTATTGTIQSFVLVIVPSFLVWIAFAKAGGASFVFNKLAQAPAHYTNVVGWPGQIEFGIMFALGNYALITTDQMFWQKIWSYKRIHLEKIILRGGIYFFPIPLALGMLGLIGYSLGADLQTDLAGDIAGIGPWTLKHLGLHPIYLVLYVSMVIAAGFSTIDASFNSVSAVTAVDLIRHYAPKTSKAKLFFMTRCSMAAAGIIGLLMIVTGLPMTKIWMVLFGMGSARCLPFIFSLYWKKCNGNGAFWGTVLGGLLSLFGFFSDGLYGIPADALGFAIAILLSLIVCVGWSLISPDDYDWCKLQLEDEALCV